MHLNIAFPKLVEVLHIAERQFVLQYPEVNITIAIQIMLHIKRAVARVPNSMLEHLDDTVDLLLVRLAFVTSEMLWKSI